MRKLIREFAIVMVLFFITSGLVAQSFSYVSPTPEAKYANPEHVIALRHGDVFDASSINASMIQVTGSQSGLIQGQLSFSVDGRTLFFNPESPFQYNETITVNVIDGIKTQAGLEMETYSYKFKTMREDNSYLREKAVKWMEESYLKEKEKYAFQVSVKNQPALKSGKEEMPVLNTTIRNNPSPGYFYITPHNPFHPIDIPGYSIIVDNLGTPVFTELYPTHTLDLKVQETGHISQFIADVAGGLGIGYGYSLLFDDHMNVIDTFQMGNGYVAEYHDFQYFNDGSFYLFTYDPQIVDMSAIVEGGDPAATVMGAIVQELDADKNVVFEWSSWDHMPITDATADINLIGVFIDYCHINAVERDHDNNILMSFRNTDDILKVDRNTGDIMWRMNAHREELNDITFLNDTIKFSHQHDIRRQDNGNVTLFDNGNLHYGPYSRVVEYAIDEVNLTAEQVWAYPAEYDSTNMFAFAMGGGHRQDNGNTVIGWGIGWGPMPIFSEVTPEGDVTFEMWSTDTNRTYRAHKFDWNPQLFTLSKDTIDWGEFTGYTPEPYILVITNNSDEPLMITDVHNHTNTYTLASALPIEVPANGTGQITINFFPSGEGMYKDVMTIMSEPDENKMIARQVVLTGYTADASAPDVAFDPADGTTDVVLMPTITATFDEMLYKAGGDVLTNAELQNIIQFNKNDATGDPIAFNAHIKWLSPQETIIEIEPAAMLETYTSYYIGFAADMLQDWTANMITEVQSMTFTTGEQLGLEELLVEESAVVYPNPCNGIVNLAFATEGKRSIEVFNINGATVYHNEISGNHFTFDIQDQPDGMYFIRLVNEKSKVTDLKVLKQ